MIFFPQKYLPQKRTGCLFSRTAKATAVAENTSNPCSVHLGESCCPLEERGAVMPLSLSRTQPWPLRASPRSLLRMALAGPDPSHARRGWTGDLAQGGHVSPATSFIFLHQVQRHTSQSCDVQPARFNPATWPHLFSARCVPRSILVTCPY